jgi:hypothetical protein
MGKRPEIAPEDCPEPGWHETHRYCPVCTWREEPTSIAESAIAEPAWESERRMLRGAIARLMRHQAALADALDLGEDDDLSAELIASRDAAKRALGR